MSEFIKQMKPHFEKATEPIILFFDKLNLSPNVLTISGLIFTAIGSYFMLQKQFILAGFIIGIGALFDALDGHLARTSGKTSKFGAFFDSVIDRISDALPLIAIAIIFKEDTIFLAITIFTIIFSFLVSYTRARAEGLGIECKVGIFERPERLIILIISLILNQVEIGILILLIGSFITFLQRFFYVYKFK
ncbi:CDP-alcohol phosphatidyltransferase family protein [Hydrogenothermus marinus]|uniref:CDP-diacylglycerol--glycerol-3-phosphate 3-phosphatidyltransferase n=1 Tax=Hydrogenothermus marinus TaxID=133270 RepID=A0A3M0BSY2_9AQUI|nr:CDP-alcohol phosphatidyltransferase family protein [Hydrogenothermus marinus]RMA97928.1 CDP-diacylglycerol--glycerol-3-phosphate 3-phosphatidyltransferase [Hydrogenothermus marinus]